MCRNLGGLRLCRAHPLCQTIVELNPSLLWNKTRERSKFQLLSSKWSSCLELQHYLGRITQCTGLNLLSYVLPVWWWVSMPASRAFQIIETVTPGVNKHAAKYFSIGRAAAVTCLNCVCLSTPHQGLLTTGTVQVWLCRRAVMLRCFGGGGEANISSTCHAFNSEDWKNIVQ